LRGENWLYTPRFAKQHLAQFVASRISSDLFAQKLKGHMGNLLHFRCRRAWGVGTLAGLLCLFPLSLRAVPYGVNLIVNGNAEQGINSPTGDALPGPTPVPGWTVSSAFTVVPYSAGGGFPTASNSGPPDRSNQFFAGGNAAISTATQDIDVSANAADINAKQVTLDLSGWLGGFASDPDAVQLTVTYLDAGSMSLSSTPIAPITPADRNNTTGLFLRNKSATVPANTVTLRVTLTMTRTTGTFNDGYADSLSVVLRAPTVVTTTADSGPGSLRAALAVGNVITFDPNVFAANSAPHVISLASALPALSVNVQIVGPGANALTVQRSTAAGTPNFPVFTVDSGAPVDLNGVRPNVTISGLTIANGSLPIGTGTGGGIFNHTGQLFVTNCGITGNTASAGGGIYTDAHTVCSVRDSTINANTATFAAAMETYNSSSYLIDSTISGNSTQTFDVLVYGEADSASMLVSNCTIVSSLAIETQTHHTGASSDVTLDNTILFGTTSGKNLVSIGGSFHSNDYNLSNRDDSASLNMAHDRNNTDPMLGPLQDNGGGTLTQALLPGSLAIDKGNSNAQLPTDQRGAGRFFDDPNSASGGGNNSDIGAFEFQGVPRVVLANISTRLRVETGDNVLIAGFIVSGYQPKKVIVRAIGPSLPFADRLADPTLELRDASGTLLDSNDNWKDSPNKQAIIDSTIAPTNDLESAIVATLPAANSSHTAIVRGAGNGTGIGVVEVYDLDRSLDSKLANISTRGLVQTGDNVLFAGDIVVGQVAQNVIIRALGPSIPVPGAMADPTLELHDANGALMEANDNWVDSPNKQAIIDSTIPPSNDMESAIVRTLSPASYTAIVRGANDSTGIAVVEVYALQ
jgi:hypothetical protein